MMYCVLSIWLAMHASIASHSFGVRMLTQLVRLPLPSRSQLDAACATGQDFEKRRLAEMMRVPVLEKQLKRLNQAMDNLTQDQSERDDAAASETASVASLDASDGGLGNEGAGRDFAAAPTGLLRHTRLFRELQGNWQAYDAYARVSMAMATNQFLHALGYYCLQMFVAENHAPWPGFCCVMMLSCCAWLLVRLDVSVPPRTQTLVRVMNLAPEAIAILGISLLKSDSSKGVQDASDVLAPIAFALHMAWIAFIVNIARPVEFGSVALPINFRTVLYLDVFCWLQPPPAQAEAAPAAQEAPGPMHRQLSAVAEEPELRLHGWASQPELATADKALEEPPAGLRRAVSAGRVHANDSLRTQLCGLCSEAKEELEGDLRRWASDEVDDGGHARGVATRLRFRFHGIVED